ncbi:MAG TPA: PaaI family thioesterase [Acidimicrobiales bacterium]|jgi:acyl-coenzyme A thioesterase PaaI-like protein|nr:PaaI family thioesterase [Acidimicrobiales bacterium]|tara:strand:+ start:2485 stop:3144 length:660 start_codon:yes stop_codon:yes gene_type:complete
MSTWDAVSRAAAAMRRLNRALSGRRLPDDTLEEVSVAVHDLADRFDAGTKRSKLDDMMTRPHLAAIYSGQYTPLELAVGEEIEFDPFSLAGGEFHPASIGLIFIKESDDSVVGAGTIDPMFAGPPERVHGGIQALIIDEVMGALNRMRGRQAYTAYLHVEYRGPAPLGVHVTFRAWVHETDGRKIYLKGSGEGPDGRFLDAEGLFIQREDQPEGSLPAP